MSSLQQTPTQLLIVRAFSLREEARKALLRGQFAEAAALAERANVLQQSGTARKLALVANFLSRHNAPLESETDWMDALVPDED